MEAYGKHVSDDVEVRGRISFGAGTVTLIMCPGDMKWTCDLDPEIARELGLALMDAANEIDRRLTKKREPVS